MDVFFVLSTRQGGRGGEKRGRGGRDDDDDNDDDDGDLCSHSLRRNKKRGGQGFRAFTPLLVERSALHFAFCSSRAPKSQSSLSLASKGGLYSTQKKKERALKMIAAKSRHALLSTSTSKADVVVVAVPLRCRGAVQRPAAVPLARRREADRRRSSAAVVVRSAAPEAGGGQPQSIKAAAASAATAAAAAATTAVDLPSSSSSSTSSNSPAILIAAAGSLAVWAFVSSPGGAPVLAAAATVAAQLGGKLAGAEIDDETN